MRKLRGASTHKTLTKIVRRSTWSHLAGMRKIFLFFPLSVSSFLPSQLSVSPNSSSSSSSMWCCLADSPPRTPRLAELAPPPGQHSLIYCSFWVSALGRNPLFGEYLPCCAALRCLAVPQEERARSRFVPTEGQKGWTFSKASAAKNRRSRKDVKFGICRDLFYFSDRTWCVRRRRRAWGDTWVVKTVAWKEVNVANSGQK